MCTPVHRINLNPFHFSYMQVVLTFRIRVYIIYTLDIRRLKRLTVARALWEGGGLTLNFSETCIYFIRENGICWGVKMRVYISCSISIYVSNIKGKRNEKSVNCSTTVDGKYAIFRPCAGDYFHSLVI